MSMEDNIKKERQRKAQEIVESLQRNFGQRNIRLTEVRLDDLVPKEKK